MEEQQVDENASRIHNLQLSNESTEEQQVDENASTIQNPAQQVDELDLQLSIESMKGVLVKKLCAKDVYGNPKFLWLPKKQVEENLLQPPFPKKGQETQLIFRDPIEKETFEVELVCYVLDEYQVSGSGWDKYANQHKLECGDFISCYKKKGTYEIYTWKLPSESIVRIPVLVKNLCAKDLARNPNCLRLSKKEVEQINLVLQRGATLMLPLNDTIRKESMVVLVVHTDQDEYYIKGSDWEEYVAQHKLLIIEDTTIFVNKVIVDPTAEVQLVNTTFHYEITYQITTAVDNSSAHPSTATTTAVDNSSAPPSTATTTAVDNSLVPASTATTTTVDNSSAPASTATTTAVDNSSAPASTATTTAVDNCSAPASTATTTAVYNSSAPASTATTTAVDNSSAPASSATTTAVDNCSAPASTAATTAVDKSSAPASTASTTAVDKSSAPASTATTFVMHNSSAPASTATTSSVYNSSAPASTSDNNNS